VSHVEAVPKFQHILQVAIFRVNGKQEKWTHM